MPYRVNRNRDTDLTTKDNVTRDSLESIIKRFAFIVASSVRDTN